MSSINYDLTKIKAFVFDVDGVLSCDVVSLHPNGDPMRTVNIKDGYAPATGCKERLPGRDYYRWLYGRQCKSVFPRLGIEHIYMRSAVKIHDFNDFLQKTGLTPEEVMYAGDDIPDYDVMKRVGLPVAPADAAPGNQANSEIYLLMQRGRRCCPRCDRTNNESTRPLDERRSVRMVITMKNNYAD